MKINHLEFSEKDYNEYIEQLNRECASDSALSEISYRYETEQKTQTIAERIFSSFYSLVSLPYQLVHWIAGLCSKSPISCHLPDFTKERTTTNCLDLWRYKRISIAVDDDIIIDAMLVVRSDSAKSDKWILHSNTFTEVYESHKRYCSLPKKLTLDLKANLLVFNYPGVGASQGIYTQKTIAKTYQAMLRFLEDKEKGIGAHAIIGQGFCAGGNLQGDALKEYELNPEIKYVFIKDRSACELSRPVSRAIFYGVGKLFALCGWNMDTLSSSKKLQAHEILLHTANVEKARQVRNPDSLIDDGVLAKEDTLGYQLLSNPDTPGKLIKTTIIGIPELHKKSLSTDTRNVLTEKIKAALESNEDSNEDYEEQIENWE